LKIYFQDTLSIQAAQKRAQENDLRDRQKRELQSMESEGQNGLFYMLRKQKNEKLEQMQKSFAEQQEKNRLTIVEKILKEENEKERKRKLYPELYKKPSTGSFSAPVKQPKQQLDATRTDVESTETRISQPPLQLAHSSSQLDNDPIDYASSMTSAYQQDELDDGNFH